jgi:CDP-glycerol glycerophosphotransferase (TagB/SpsB family)
MTLLRSLRRLDDALLPRGRMRRVLIDGRTAMNFEMVAPIVEALASDDRIQFFCTASEDPDRLADIYQHAPSTITRISPRRAALAKWAAYLTSDFTWATLPRGTARVQIFHGVAGKYDFDAPTESMRGWDRLFFVNQRRLKNFVRSGAIIDGSPAARLVGMPKVDCLVDGTFQRDAILTAHGLDPARSTVLYAPTWSAESSLNRMGAELIERLVQRRMNVIVKLHDRSFDLRQEYSGGIDWTARLLPLLPAGQALLARNPNIAEYLAASDVMVTDHSSAGFEYLLLDRPLVRIEIPDLLRRANVHPDYIDLIASASTTVRSADEAVSAVDAALSHPLERSASRRAVASELFYRPGTAAVRAAKELSELLELSEHPSLAALERKAKSCLQTA